MSTVFILLIFSVTMSLVSGCFLAKYNTTDNVQFELTIPEGLLKDNIVETYSQTDNITLRVQSGNLPSFLVAREGSLYTNAALDFDNNVTLCAEKGPWLIIVGCASDPTKEEIYIVIEINYTDNFNPEIAGNHSINVSEMTSVDTELFDLNRLNAYVFDRDCNSDNFIMFYELEDYSFPFTLRWTILYLTRILDFESGDKKFDLNISVTEVTSSRKGYALLTVIVIDVDENLFCHCNQTTEGPKPGSTVTVGDFENITTSSIWTETTFKQANSTTTFTSTVIE